MFGFFESRFEGLKKRIAKFQEDLNRESEIQKEKAIKRKNERINAEIVAEYGDMGGYGKYCMYHDGRTIGFWFPNGYKVYTSECGASYARRHGIEVMRVLDNNGNEMENDIIKNYSSELGYGFVESDDIMSVLEEIKELPAIV